MIDVLVIPGMKTKGETRSFGCSYHQKNGVKRDYADQKQHSVMRPAKDGWYPLNVVYKEIYD